MFHHKFFLHAPVFSSQLEDYNGNPRGLARFGAFMLFAHELFGWFLSQAQLQSVKLTSVALPEFEKNPLAVRIRHHFKLETAPSTLTLVEDINQFAVESLPYSDMSHGVFAIDRADPLVQQVLALDKDEPLAYRALVFSLADRIESSFPGISVVHDLGVAKPLGD